MIKILVTGGAGFIGSHLVKRLINSGFDVVVIDNLSTGKEKNIHPKASFHKIDICNEKKIRPLFKGVSYVFHLAALPRIQRSIEYPKETHRSNVEGTLNVLLASREMGVKRFIYASSSSVYGQQISLPLKENFVPNPISPYAVQKLVGEYYCKVFSKIYNLETVVLRYFSVYGPYQNEQDYYATVIPKFFKLKKESMPLIIYGDGNESRDFTYIDDVVESMLLSLKSNLIGNGEIINICFGKGVSINQVADIIGGKRIYCKARKGEPKHTLGDNSLAKKLLGWHPIIGLKEGLNKLQNF
jgi:nucleoside-diphosphate-sugar epimerase